ncbi:hypothetical protein A5750_02285 [Mycobacterium sp. 852002-51613_SCH5001154]|uniref:hypothetical protein n=1 Tax=Mycobacterium sp. 852002-51613_SCH5001154 TaxID=1834104 RepID=UPI0007FE1067|nr:hypothetical protein [Mycobacterium sp. 852002-51613_SCH5001154]OBF71365.1 hypothetical protein A5750_02285 [Mycobacterium sp. 852002-51613_SCH5001154]
MRGLYALGGLTAVAILGLCATATAAPSPPGSHTEKWIDLQTGQCVADLPPIDLSRVTVTVVDCATAHLAEVYLRAPMAVDKAVAIVANKDCNDGFAPYTGRPIAGSPFSITYLIDSNQDRTGANPTPSTVICLLQSANGQALTGSARR